MTTAAWLEDRECCGALPAISGRNRTGDTLLDENPVELQAQRRHLALELALLHARVFALVASIRRL